LLLATDIRDVLRHWRRYKTGFVWHDVLEDDVLRPAQGSEYVLKGSLLLSHHSPPAALVAAPPSAGIL